MDSYTLTTSSISYTKPLSTLFLTTEQPSYILRNINVTSHPSQILAIVGPSGAGKSTLLDILAARTSPTSGSILLNSIPINPSSYRKISSYVPQHDAFFPLLTVSETFTFSASLLLPKSPSKVYNAVASLLKELNLTHLAHTRLGQGLSGGERRRVSIGLSLLHDPEFLLLDEPTSGLDSKSAFDVVQILKLISTSRQRTVILSIHQPSFKILTLIDRMLLLSKGTVVYHGRVDLLEAFLLSKGFTVPAQLNSLEYTMEILQELPYENANITLPDHCSENPKQNTKQSIVRYKSSRITEISLLSRRFWKNIYRTRQLLLTNILEALVVGLVLGTIYLNIGTGKEGIQKRFGLFAFTLTFLLSSTTQTLPIFIDERPILLRETSSGLYRISSHILANTFVFLPYLLLIATIYSVSLYFLVGLCPSWQAFAYFVLVIWIIVLMANSFVLFLSSLAPNYIAGTSLVTVLLAAFFLFSGYFICKESLPKYWLVMYYFSMYKYALDALLINEYSCLHNKCMVWFGEGNVKGCLITGGDVLDKKGLHENQRWFNVYVLLGFFVLYRVLCFVVLLKRVSCSKR
ncbi:ABC transporter G family member 4 [Cardamine amara subsp. amara]|uniref:ABC transporter G family member 4 n=1 Tax=Cardamine amara subsp. amara TaxID=228776 RepID=A0ABD1A7U8_CARAN